MAGFALARRRYSATSGRPRASAFEYPNSMGLKGCGPFITEAFAWEAYRWHGVMFETRQGIVNGMTADDKALEWAKRCWA